MTTLSLYHKISGLVNKNLCFSLIFSLLYKKLVKLFVTLPIAKGIFLWYYLIKEREVHSNEKVSWALRKLKSQRNLVLEFRANKLNVFSVEKERFKVYGLQEGQDEKIKKER